MRRFFGDMSVYDTEPVNLSTADNNASLKRTEKGEVCVIEGYREKVTRKVLTAEQKMNEYNSGMGHVNISDLMRSYYLF